MDQERADTAAYAMSRRFVCTHQMAALFCVKWRHGRHLESVTSYRKSDSVNRCLFAWRTILPNFIPILLETMRPEAIFEQRRPNNNNNNKMSSDIGSSKKNRKKQHSSTTVIVLGIIIVSRSAKISNGPSLLSSESSLHNDELDSAAEQNVQYEINAITAARRPITPHSRWRLAVLSSNYSHCRVAM